MKRLLVLAALVSTGCAVTSVSLTTVHPNPGRMVTAEVSRLNVLGLSSLPQEQIDGLLEELNDKCDGAGVTGVTTRTSSTWAVIGMVEKVEATGYCRADVQVEQ